MALREYRRKRDFKKSAEPSGRHPRAAAQHRFVIQKHAASHLHYDFRLEMGGTLKSWAVPKRIPFSKGEKRLAVQVEDHPVSYAGFEGSIPKGQYGGGTVMLWDSGTYASLSGPALRAWEAGKIHFLLSGHKLKGEWYLVRLRDGKQWLLIRGGKSMPTPSKRLDDSSVLSGKTMEELADNSSVPSGKPPRNTPARRRSDVETTSSPLTFVEPMLAKATTSPPSGDWVYEIKFDGFRALALKQGRKVALRSRNDKDLAEKFPEIRQAIARIDARNVTLDGEIVALDARGRPSFQLLQDYEFGRERPPVFFYAFDLLGFERRDLRAEPLVERKSILKKLLRKAPPLIRYSASLNGDVKILLAKADRLGLEGLIGKRKDSIYEAGRRSGAWIKLKLHRAQEMVIGGYTVPTGNRKYFGALLVGYYENNHLKFAGKVGTGFDANLLRDVLGELKPLKEQDCPFVNLPEKQPGRYSTGLTAREMKRCQWVKPRLVCQVRFTEWTRDGKLRHPVFLGLRNDKLADEVVRESSAVLTARLKTYER
jgi:bifunctional non-homologous end joining protein LigD